MVKIMKLGLRKDRLRTCPYDSFVECNWIHVANPVANKILPIVKLAIKIARMWMMLLVLTYNRTTASIAYHEHISSIEVSPSFTERCQRCCFWLRSKSQCGGSSSAISKYPSLY